MTNVPHLPGPHGRAIQMLNVLYDEITAAASATSGSVAFRIGQLQRDFDRFSANGLITVGYGKDKSCFMKLLDPKEDEVWEIRSRDPKPSLRVFGRFVAKDVFLATHKAWREDLGAYGSEEWAREIWRCKAVWRQLFPTYPPHSGVNIYDYISRNVVEVGYIA